MTDDSYHHGNLRTVLLEEAERVIRESGHDAVSLRELARVANVSPGAPRSHFRSRQDLLNALVERGFQRLKVALETAVHDAGSDFVVRLHAVAAAYISFGLADPNLLTLMTIKNDAAHLHSLERARDEAYEVLNMLIPEGQADGRVQAGSVNDVGVPFFAAVHGTTLLLISRALPIDEQTSITRNVVEHALRGIAPPCP